MRKFLLLFLSILFLAHSTVFAQKIKVNARLDSTVMWIGNQAHLSFEVTQQPKQKVVMPLFSDSIVKGLDLVEQAKTDTVKSENGSLKVTQHYVVTAFKDSILTVRPFPFVINGDTVWSNSLTLKVVQPFKVDTAASSIADIKPVYEPKFDWVGFIQTILLILVILALLVVLYIYVRKYWQKKPIFEKTPEPALPPHVIALNHLDKIKEDKPWQHGRSKEYHTELTDIIREYIEPIFGVKSMEMTSEEILYQLRTMRKNDKMTYLALQQILQLADLVKFAKWNPLPDEHELSLKNAYLFVNQTTKVEEVVPTEEKQKEVKSE